MPERNLQQMRVKELLAQDTEINDTHLKEFRMLLEQSIESLEEKSKKTRRRILIALAIYLTGMVICWTFVALWQDVAPNAAAAKVRGLIYWPFLITTLVAVLVGIWAVALYVFKYAPQINRARFDVQMSVMLELQQQMKQLHEKVVQKDQ